MAQELGALWLAFCARPGDDTFAPLYEHSQRLVYTICWRLLRNGDDALDAFQATYSRLVALAKGEAAAADASLDSERLIARLAVREAQNLCKRRGRRHQREAVMDELSVHADPGPSPMASAQVAEARTRLEAMIDTLPERERLAVQLHYFHGLTHDEVARTLGLPRPTVTHRIARALRRLRPALERAGLSEAGAAFSAAVAGAALLSPPASATAAEVMTQSLLAAAAGKVGTSGLLGLAKPPSLLHWAVALKVAATLAVLATVVAVAATLKPADTGASAPPLAGIEQPLAASPSNGAASAATTQTAAVAAALPNAPAPAAAPSTTVAASAAAATTATAAMDPTSSETQIAQVTWAVDGRPAVGARVELANATAGQPPATVATTAGADGLASLTYPASWKTGRLTVTHADAAATEQLFDFVPGQARKVTLELGAQISGTVWLKDKGEAAVDKEVRLYTMSGCGAMMAEVARTRTDASGAYVLRNVPSQPLAIVADPDESLCDLEPGHTNPIHAVPGENLQKFDLTIRPGGRIKGTIVAAQTGQPLAGVKVRAFNGRLCEVLTDARGEYVIGGLPAQRVELVAQAAGYGYKSVLASVDEGQERIANLNLPVGVDVTVKVSDPAGKPVEGARVYLSDLGGLSGDANPQTNAEGLVTVTNYPATCEFRIVAQKDGYRYFDGMTPKIEPGKATANAAITLRPNGEGGGGGVYAGQVTDEGGKPLEGITVGYGYPTNHGNPETHTDASGAYRLAVPAVDGFPSLYAYGSDRVSVRVEVPAPNSAEQPSRHDFKLAPGHWLKGKAVDAAGQPVKGLYVQASMMRSGLDFPNMNDNRTAADGSFLLRNLPVGPLQLILYGHGWSRQVVEEQPVDQELSITMQPAAEIRGQVLDARSKTPLREFVVKLSGNYTEVSRMEQGELFTTQDGRFTLRDLDLGQPYNMTVEATGMAPTRLMQVKAVLPGQGEEHSIEVGLGEQLQGRVIDAATSQPLGGATIYYGLPRYPNQSMQVEWSRLARGGDGMFEQFQQVAAGPDGGFVFQLTPDQGMLFIEAPGAAHCGWVRAEWPQPDANGVRSFVLPRGATVRGRLLAEGKPAAGVALLLDRSRRREGKAVLAITPVELTTDAEGRFEMSGLAAGHYMASPLRRQGSLDFAAYTYRFDLGEGETKEIELGGAGLGNLTMKGRVMAAGQPLAHCDVSLRPGFDWDYANFCSFTDSEGRYEIRGLRPGKYGVGLRERTDERLGERSREEQLELTGDLEKDFSFEPTHQVRGRLVFPEGFPDEVRQSLKALNVGLADRDVAVALQQSNPEQLSLYGQAALQGKRFTLSGRFRGVYAFQLNYGQDAMQRSLTVGPKVQLNTLTADQDVGEIKLPSLGKLQVRVELSTTEVAAPRQILLTLIQGDADSRVTHHLMVQPGEATLDVPLGHYQAVLSGMGWKTSAEKQEIDITANGLTRLDFKLSPSCAIIGYLLIKGCALGDSSNQPQTRKVTLDGPNGWHREVTGISKEELYKLERSGKLPEVKDLAVGNYFTFADVPAGNYEVTLEAEGYAPLKRSVTAVLGEAEPIRFDLPAKP